MQLLLRGIMLGFAIAAPVGPIGLLCIRRTLAHGWRAGFVSGLGAATADTMYGLLAAFGITALAAFQQPAAVIGGFLLLWMAYQTATSIPQKVANVRAGNMYLSTLALTITNPATILVFLSLFAGVSGVSALGANDAVMLVVGVGLGSAMWWLVLASIAAWLGRDISTTGLQWMNRISGILIGGFGIAALWSVFI